MQSATGQMTKTTFTADQINYVRQNWSTKAIYKMEKETSLTQQQLFYIAYRILGLDLYKSRGTLGGPMGPHGYQNLNEVKTTLVTKGGAKGQLKDFRINIPTIILKSLGNYQWRETIPTRVSQDAESITIKLWKKGHSPPSFSFLGFE